MPTHRSPRIAIVGAGFGGIGMAIQLEQAGLGDFQVFERGDRIGGVWRENTYPGAGCDVPSPLYSFSFEANPRWPYRYSKQESILGYLEDCVEKYGVADRIRLTSEVTDAHWSAEAGAWELTVNGASEVFDLLICACGQLSEPTIPTFPGRESFTGHSFHSAHWDHDYPLAGKRVAVVGTGASAIQFVPEIQPQVAELFLFQRSPPFIVPKPDHQYSPFNHAAFDRVPPLLGAERLSWYLLGEVGQIALADHPRWFSLFEKAARWNLAHGVKDAAKRVALTSHDVIGCKRLLFSNNYYPALGADNVEVITEAVASIGPSSVVTESGLRREVDVIIYATGFASHGFVAPMTITGRDGVRLAEDAWGGGASAYLGITVPDFPNLFLLYGPNTNLGFGSIVHMLESQIRYVLDAARHLARSAGGAYSVRSARARFWDAEMQRRLSGSAWSSGCESWYIDENGRNSNNWPGTMTEYRWRTREFRPVDYEVLDSVTPAPRTERGAPA